MAASLGVHWNDECLFAGEDRSVIRPDGLILGYPVITAGKYAHRESMEMLAGPDPAASEGNLAGPGYYGLEAHVDAQTPPAFIWHTAGDSTVAVQNSLCFAESLAAKGVPFEMHIYPYGEHGLSLATMEVEEPENTGTRTPMWQAGLNSACNGWTWFSQTLMTRPENTPYRTVKTAALHWTCGAWSHRSG